MIIYVEDNINNQRLMQRMMRKRGYEVACYDSIDLAYEAIITNPPKMLFVDLHLKSRQTGMDLVRRLRDENYEMPIIIVTVFNMIADRKRALKEGCNDYLSKPYTMDDLLSIVDRYLTTNV